MDDTPSNLIGFFCDTPMVGSSYFSLLQIGLMAGCQKWNSVLAVRSFDLTSKDLAARVRAVLDRTSLRGVILPEPTCEIAAVLDTVLDSGLPLVRIAPHSETSRTFDICIDNVTATYDLTRHLLDHGHRHILFLEGPPGHGDGEARKKGFCKAMADAGIALTDKSFAVAGFDYAQGAVTAEKVLALDPLPTAIMAGNDEVAAAVLAVAHRRGLSIPQDFSLTGFDDAPLARQIWPALTTCRQKMELLGYMAVDFIVDPPAPGDMRQRPLQHELVIRQSTGPVPR